MSAAQDQSTGAPEIPTHAAPLPQRVTLKGRYVTLVPLEAGHADALYEGAHGSANEAVWTYLYERPFKDRSDFAAHIAAKAASKDPLFYAIADARSGAVLGYQTLMRIDPANRVIEVGNILYTPALQRTPGATEAQYLFARYIFETLGYRRYEWKCNDLNAPSRRAALRFGFTYEGTFRQHLIVKGRNRDTAWYSMLDSEWPARKAAFEAWLAPANFDAAGRQKKALGDFHREIKP